MVEPIVESSTETVLNVAKAEAIRVLHVDDDQICLKIAKQCLEMQSEFEVDTASSVNEALEKLKKTDYDVIVSDYQMPGKDGLEFLEELREKGNTVPFLIFTGKGREEIVMKALNLGASGYFAKQGQPETVYGELAYGIRQATKRKKAEMKMWEREERLRAVFHSSPDAITVSDLHGNILDCSEAAWKMFGFSSKEEAIGKSSFDFIGEKERQEALENLKKTLEQGTTRNAEYTLLNKNGEKFWGELAASIVKDLLGNPVGFVGVIRDVTERKKAEQTLKESEEKYRSLVELAPDGIVAVNTEGIITSANRSFLRLVGYDSEEGIVGKPFTELKTMRMEDIPRFQGMFMSLMKGESPSPSEFLYARRDGTSRWAEVHPGLLIKDGNPVGLQVIMRDVTESKKAEKTLQESEERFRAIFEGANDGILLADVKTKRFAFANPRICEIAGYSLEELLKLGVGDIHPKKDLPHVIDSFTKLVQGKLTLAKDLPVLRKDGRVVYCDISARSMKIGSQEYLIGLFRDATERKKVEEEESRLLQNLHERVKELDCFYGISRLVEKSDILLDDVLQGTADMLPRAMHDPDITCARVVVENREFSTKNFKETRWKLQTDIKVHGKKAGSVEVCHLEERPTIAEGPFLKEERQLIDAVAERLGKITERRKAEDALRDAKEKWASLTENTDDIVMIVDSEGIIQYINRTMPPYTPEETIGKTVYEYVPREQHDTMRSSLKKAFETGVPLSYVVSSNIPKIGTIWFETKIVPVKDNEKTVSAILMSTDITELKNAEERLKETNKRFEITNEKLHVVGGLTRHDANNKLSAVTGYAYLLKEKHADQADIVEGLGMIERAVKEVGRIFDFARMYEQLGVEESTYVDVEKALDEAVALLSGLTINVVNDCHGLTVLADSFLRQLFYNLIDNTRKYGGKATAVRVYYEKAESGELRLVYEDDGVGISAENKLKLFTEGFSTGGSTGFGLFLIRKMMEVYGWQIQETGIQGKGAKFVITIPKANLNGKENYQLS